MKKLTKKIDFVEAHNLTLSIRRLRNAPGYSTYGKWRIALYSALVTDGSLSRTELTEIRQTLGLP